MAINTVQVWTYVVGAGSSFLITYPEYGFTTVSVKATGGEVYVSGNGVSNGLPSSNIALTDGQSITIDGGNGNIIEYLSITAGGGDAHILAR